MSTMDELQQVLEKMRDAGDLDITARLALLKQASTLYRLPVVAQEGNTLSIRQAIEIAVLNSGGRITTSDGLVWVVSNSSFQKMIARQNQSGEKPFQRERILAIQQLSEIAGNCFPPLIRPCDGRDTDMESIYEYYGEFQAFGEIRKVRLLCKKFKERRSLKVTSKMHSMAMDGESPVARFGTDGVLDDLELVLDVVGSVPERRVPPSVVSTKNTLPARRMIVDSVASMARVKLIAELAGLKKTLTGAGVAPLARMKATSRAGAIRQELGANAGPKSIPFDLSQPDASERALYDYMKTAARHIPAALLPFEMRTVEDLGHAVGQYTRVATATDAILKQGGFNAADTDRAKLDAFDYVANQGVKLAVDTEQLRALDQQADEIMRQSHYEDPEYKKLVDEYDTLSNKFNKITNELYDLIEQEKQALASGNKTSRDDLIRLNVAYERAVDEYKATTKPLVKAYNEFQPKFNAERSKKAMAVYAEAGTAVIQAVLEKSPISHEEAHAWASQQTIDKDAEKKLKASGYKKDQIIADMAEFYRMVAGKSQNIRIALNGAKRASAHGLGNAKGEKIIVIDNNFNKTTLFHELAHFIEDDPIAKGAANGYLIKRRKNADLVRIDQLLPNHGFRKDEVVWEDDFLHPYVGKYYADGCTEVFSMGVQHLATPHAATKLASQDPELFALITGYMTGSVTPAMQAKLNAHKASGGIRASRDEIYEQAIATLAQKIPLTQDGWWDEVQKMPINQKIYLLDYLKHRSKKNTKLEYLGSYGDYRFFYGVFSPIGSGRYVKSWFVAKLGAASFSDDVPDFRDSCPVPESLDFAKVIVAMCEKDTSKRMMFIYRDYCATRNKLSKDPAKMDSLILAAGLEAPTI